MGTIIFNGVSTAEMGVVVQAPPTYSFPDKEYDVVSIEGRSGDIVIPKNSYSNVRRTYQIAAIFKPNSTFISNAGELVDWLMTSKGYTRLEDSYEPDFYRKALYRYQGELTNYQDTVTTMTLMFECKPQRYLKLGEQLVELPINGTVFTLYNTEQQIALPEFKAHGNKIEITITSGQHSHKVTIDNGSVKTIIINSDLQDCYNDTELLNSNVILTNGFPKLYPGKNEIKITGTGITKVEVKPNWWRL